MIAEDNPLVTIEKFEKIRPGVRAIFSPRDAVGGPRGTRKSVKGIVRTIDSQGRAYIGDWIVPLNRVQRYGSGVYREWAKAERKAQRHEVYGSLKPDEKKALEACAKNARAAFLSTSTYNGPVDKSFLAEAKRRRESYMAEHGINDTSDRGQCEALPLFLEKALNRGIVPTLKDVEYVSADSGTVGVGDTISLGGHSYKIIGYTPEGKLTLKNSHTVNLPSEYIARDIESPTTSIFKKLDEKRKQRLAKMGIKKPSAAIQRPRRPRRDTGLSIAALFRRKRQQRRKGPSTVMRRPHLRHIPSGVAAAYRLLRPKRARHQTLLCRDGLGRFSSCGPLAYRRFKRLCFIDPHTGRRAHQVYLRRLQRARRNPRAKVVVERDLLGREQARLDGGTTYGEQIPLFECDHKFTVAEKAQRKELEKDRKRRQRERKAGQRELPFSNPRRRKHTSSISPLLMVLGCGALAYWVYSHFKLAGNT